MPQLSTGLIIAGAYADKVRRVLFAQLKDEIKQGRVSSQEVAYKAGLLNRILYEILVNKLKIDKGDVVRVRIEYNVVNGSIEWVFDKLQVEAFRRINQEEVDAAVKEVIEKVGDVLAAPPTAEEREWTGGIEVSIGDVIELGRTAAEEKLFLLKDEKNNNIGIAIYIPSESRLEALVIKKKEAYKATIRMDKEPTSDDVKSLLGRAVFEKTRKEEAEKIIKEKMMEIV